MIHIVDLHFLDIEQTIAAYIVETSAGPVIVETGPFSVYPNLDRGISNLGFRASDVEHVLLTHIHFDHAGAAWALAEAGATVYVHPAGYKHLLDPSRLYGSAKRIYGDQMEVLWGAMEPIPADQLVAVEDKTELVIGDTTFIAHHTPGHASHHIAWQLEDVCFTGDVAGVCINNGPVVPPCPPPDIDIETWVDSILRLRKLNFSALYLGHYGPIYEINPHLDELIEILMDWARWIKKPYDAGRPIGEVVSEFQAYAANQLKAKGADAYTISQYEAANPAWMSVAGLYRYWKKREERDKE